MRSPKNKFLGTIDLVVRKSDDETATTPMSVTGTTVDEVKHLLKGVGKRAEHLCGEHRIVIKENKSAYPDFNWVIVETSTITI